MYTMPMIFPLDAEGEIYALEDETGKMIGTGTREVCEVLLYIISKASPGTTTTNPAAQIPSRPNLRAAIAI